jgi:signal transduction histidine kinase
VTPAADPAERGVQRSSGRAGAFAGATTQPMAPPSGTQAIGTPAWLFARCVDAAQLALLEQGAGTSTLWRVALAWHLRQRDTPRALALANDAELLRGASAPPLAARLLLVRAEACWLQAELPAALLLADRVDALLAGSGDGSGLSDAQCLRALVAFDQGRAADALAHLRQAQAQADAAGDTARAAATLAMQACFGASGDVEQAERDWAATMKDLCGSAPAEVAMWAHDFEAQVHRRRGRYAAAIANHECVLRYALAAGQTRRAIDACLNAATNHIHFNDHLGALEWIERGLVLARPAAWPGTMAPGLMLLGRVLTRLDRPAAARQAFDDALVAVQPLAGSRTAAITLFHASELAHQMGDHARAAAGQQQVIADAETSGMADLAEMAKLGLANAWLGLQRPADALDTATQALVVAEREHSASGQFGALLALADAQQAQAPSAASNASLPFLLRALAVAGTMKDFVVAPHTWDRLAAAYADRGDVERAYEMACQAGAARAEVLRHEGRQRAIATAVRTDIEGRRAESERLRAAAAQAAEQAALLQSTHNVLEQLGQIGQQITAQLAVDEVFDRIHGHLHTLVDAPHLSIWLLDDSGQTLHLRFGREEGHAMQPARVSVDADFSNVARCLREQRELLHGSAPDAVDASHMPGTLRTLTALFGPLRVRDRPLGVMSIQSPRQAAYGERERLIFRTLCAYGAIALNNAAVVQQIEAARRGLQLSIAGERLAREQAQRAMQQKSRFLVSVSQSLRKPLADLHESLAAAVATPGAAKAVNESRRLARAFAQSHRVAGLARELLELARLESMAVEPALETFSLAELAYDVLDKCAPEAQRKQQRLVTDFAAGMLDVSADIGMIERVMTTLLAHAIERSAPSTDIVLQLQPGHATVQVRWVDTGPPLDAPAAQDLFERPQAGDGNLALVICRQLLLLHGSEPVVHRTLAGATAVAFQLSHAAPP